MLRFGDDASRFRQEGDPNQETTHGGPPSNPRRCSEGSASSPPGSLGSLASYLVALASGLIPSHPARSPLPSRRPVYVAHPSRSIDPASIMPDPALIMPEACVIMPDPASTMFDRARTYLITLPSSLISRIAGLTDEWLRMEFRETWAAAI